MLDADIATAEAHLLADRPEQALGSSGRRSARLPPFTRATLLPAAYRVQAAALFASGCSWRKPASAVRRWIWSRVPHQTLRTSVASCSPSVPAWHVRNTIPTQTGLQNRHGQPFTRLGVVRVPLPECARDS